MIEKGTSGMAAAPGRAAAQLLLAVTLTLAALFAVTCPAAAGTITLEWHANSEPDLAGYQIYYGTASRLYTSVAGPVEVNPLRYPADGLDCRETAGGEGDFIRCTLLNIPEGRTYHFAATAYDALGNESGFSNEVVGSSDEGQATVYSPRFSDLFRRPATLSTRWRRISGGWNVRRRFLLSTSLSRAGLIIARPVRGLLSGRLEGRFRITEAATGEPNAGFLFSYRRRRQYRYVTFRIDRVDIGQVGDTPGQGAGVAASVPREIAPGEWHRARIDLFPDGGIEVYLDDETEPSIAYTFGDPLPGRCGLLTRRARARFDTFRVWEATAPGESPAGTAPFPGGDGQ